MPTDTIFPAVPTPPPPPAAPPASPPPRDDELDDLPPLDGESPDEEGHAPELDEEPAGGDASLDDATGEDDPVDPAELDIDDGEGGWLEGTDDAEDLDMGETPLVELEAERDPMDDVEEPGVGDEDFGIGQDGERAELDSGEEGPAAEDEALREEDLPALDADEEGEVEDADLMDPGFASDEPLGLPWAAEPCARVGAPVGLAAATAVACATRGVIVAGRVEGVDAPALLRVDLEGTCERLAADGLDAARVRSIAVEGRVVAVVVEGGRVSVSRDGGATFDAVTARWTAADVALAGGALFVLASDGALLAAGAEPPYAFARCATTGAAAAMAIDAAASGPAPVLLVVDAAGKPASLDRARRGAPAESGAVGDVDARVPAVVAARAGHVAYAARRGGVARRDPAGAWSAHGWDGQVTALAFVDDDGTLLAATYSDVDDTTALVRLDAQGHAAVVARVGAARVVDGDSDGRALAMACDDAHGVVWIAGGFGVAAFATR